MPAPPGELFDTDEPLGVFAVDVGSPTRPFYRCASSSRLRNVVCAIQDQNREDVSVSERELTTDNEDDESGQNSGDLKN
jgi:hypothetical protein